MGWTRVRRGDDHHGRPVGGRNPAAPIVPLTRRIATEVFAYLNDHLAGSVVGLALLDHIEGRFAGTPAGTLARALRPEVEEDRRTLEAIIAALGLAESPPRQAVGWLSEKLTEFKLWADDPGAGPLHRLEALEALSLGIEGKRLLWLALLAAADHRIEADLGALARRAADQRERVEALRLAAAREAFAPA